MSEYIYVCVCVCLLCKSLIFPNYFQPIQYKTANAQCGKKLSQFFKPHFHGSAVLISDDSKHPEISPSSHFSSLENSLSKTRHSLPHLSPLYVNRTNKLAGRQLCHHSVGEVLLVEEQLHMVHRSY